MTKLLVSMFLILSFTGCAGPKGDQGSQGATGPAGADGQSITTVKLCKRTYAICINQSLYTPHSHTNGLLEHLPNGEYRTKDCRYKVRGCLVEAL